MSVAPPSSSPAAPWQLCQDRGPRPPRPFVGRSASPLSFPSGPKLCPKVFDSFPVSLPAAQCESCELAFLWIRTSGDMAESRSQGQCCHSATAGEVPGGPQTTADLLSRRVAEDAFLVPRRRGGTWDGVVPGVEGVCPPPDSCLGKGRGLRGERGPAALRCPDAPAPRLQHSSGVTGFHANPGTTARSTEEAWYWGNSVTGLRIRGVDCQCVTRCPPHPSPAIIHLRSGKNVHPTGFLWGLDEAPWHPHSRDTARSPRRQAPPAPRSVCRAV